MAKTPKSENEPDPRVEPEPEPAPQPEPQPDAPPVEDTSADRVPSRGAQVALDGEAQTAARGGAGGSIEENTAFKKELEAEGVVADGSTPDGSTLTGKPAPDVTGEPAKPTPPVANTDTDKPKE